MLDVIILLKINVPHTFSTFIHFEFVAAEGFIYLE